MTPGLGVLLMLIAAVTTLGGCFSLGIWAGLGMAADRAQQAANDALWARVRARQALGGSLLLADPPTAVMPAAVDPGPGWRLPGYAGPFPRAGYLPLNAAPHAGYSRPPTSPVDLEADVRRMCQDNELYIAALIARTRHAERNYTW